MSEENLVVLSPFEVKKDELQKMADDYGTLVVTELTFKAADLVRKQFKAKRTEIQRIVDSRKTARLGWKRDEDAKDEKLANEFLAILTPTEKRLEAELNAISERQKREAAELIRKEDERKRTIKNRILKMENQITFIRACQYQNILNGIADEISMEKDSFEEFNVEGNQVIETLLQAINNRKIVLEGEREAEEIDKKNKYARFETRNKWLLNNGYEFWGSERFAGTPHFSPINKSLPPLDREDIYEMSEESFASQMEMITTFFEELTYTRTISEQNEVEEKILEEIEEEKTTISSPGVGISPFNYFGNGMRHITAPAIPELHKINVPLKAADLNIFSFKEYTFGMSKNVPFECIMSIREAIEKILA